MRSRVAAVGFLLLAATACPRPEPTLLPLPNGVFWAQNPNLPPGGEIAVVAGTPGAAGPYATRVRFPRGFKVMPHTHPDDRVYTVLAGRWTIGIGTAFDSTTLKRLSAGETYTLPAGTPHFHYAQYQSTEFQVNGTGPTATVYVRPEDDPRRP
jgi:quercetin dioxygenase-like cupin family protein